jgi:hypothetical protein
MGRMGASGLWIVTGPHMFGGLGFMFTYFHFYVGGYGCGARIYNFSDFILEFFGWIFLFSLKIIAIKKVQNFGVICYLVD